MAQPTNIEWTEQSWNFLRGCRRVSPGCENCYAERQAIRGAYEQRTTAAGTRTGPGPYNGLVKSTPKGPRWTGEISFHEDILLAPLKRKKPTTYFVNSMSDLFYEKVTDEMLDKAFAVMALTPQHTYQILTKRPERMKAYFGDGSDYWPFIRLTDMDETAVISGRDMWFANAVTSWAAKYGGEGPLENVWLGVSVEDQKTADERIPLLLQTPAAVRWISAEPLLGPVEFSNVSGRADAVKQLGKQALAGIDWVVVGGESGPGARACDIGWIRSIVSQCKAVHVPVFVKQLGAQPFEPARYEIVGDAGLYLNNRKGGEMNEWPEDLRIREFPEVMNAKV